MSWAPQDTCLTTISSLAVAGRYSFVLSRAELCFLLYPVGLGSTGEEQLIYLVPVCDVFGAA